VWKVNTPPLAPPRVDGPPSVPPVGTGGKTEVAQGGGQEKIAMPVMLDVSRQVLRLCLAQIWLEAGTLCVMLAIAAWLVWGRDK